jgi:hypothetical protein
LATIAANVTKASAKDVTIAAELRWARTACAQIAKGKVEAPAVTGKNAQLPG